MTSKQSKKLSEDQSQQSVGDTKMSSVLEATIGVINDSANSLKTLYFRPPGIFTNALIRKPDITTLLRDADSHENALYYVDEQDKPERRDGTRGVVDRLNDELEQLEVQQQTNEDELIQRPSVVLVPKDIEEPNEKQDQNKGVKNLMNRFNEENEKDYDVDVLCETVSQLLDKYPVEGIKEDLLGYKSKWETLNMEIMRHEETIERQRRQLSLLNISLNDRDLRSDTNESREKSVKTAAELIAEEEAEIRQLEIELERLSAS